MGAEAPIIENIKNTFIPISRYGVIGIERGKSGGTFHLQGFIQLQGRMTLKKIGGMFPWHIEKTLGSPNQAMIYCKKEGNWIEWGELGTVEKGGKIMKDKWRHIVDLAKAGSFPLIEEQYPGEYLRGVRNLHMVHAEAVDPLEIEKMCLWLWGLPGTGKSRFARDFDTNAYYKNCNKWFCGYKGWVHKSVIMDDLGKEHKCLGHHLKKWTDRYPRIDEIKGSSIAANYDTFIVTSNYSIDDIFGEDPEMCAAIKRRFKVFKVISHEVTPEGIVVLKCLKDDNLYEYVYLNKFNFNDI